MDHIDRDVREVAGTEQAFLAIDPLLGLAFDHVDDLLHRWVPMEFVGLAVGHGDPHEQEFLGLSQAGAGRAIHAGPRGVARPGRYRIGSIGAWVVFGSWQVWW